MIKTVVNYSL